MQINRRAIFALALTGPALAAGQNVAIDLVSGSYPGPYVDSMADPGFTTGSQLILWSIVHTDVDLNGIEYRLHVNGDADNDVFDLVGYASGPLSGQELLFGFDPGTLDGLGNAFSFAGPPAGFGFLDYSKHTLPVGLNAMPSDETTQSPGANVSGLEGKALIGYIIEANANFAPGVYEFSALGSIGNEPTAMWSSTQQAGPITSGNSFTLNAVPEPTSALLLLAAVPFLRRRRV